MPRLKNVEATMTAARLKVVQRTPWLLDNVNARTCVTAQSFADETLFVDPATIDLLVLALTVTSEIQRTRKLDA